MQFYLDILCKKLEIYSMKIIYEGMSNFLKIYLQGCRYLTGLLNLKYTQASGIFLYSVIGLRNPEGMDVDWSTGHLYIADSGQGKILACQENGDVCTAVITHLGHPKDLSIDQRNR